MNSLIVIPARLASTRLPQKLLLSETGQTLIQHTYESAQQAQKPVDVIVATDADEIGYAVAEFGGRFHMTDTDIASGTDRVAVVAKEWPDVDIVVNVQGDEPEIEGSAIDQLIELLENDSEAVMATMATPIRSRDLLDDPSCVKVVMDGAGRALYFSRSAIPHARTWQDSLLDEDPPKFFQHVGLYAYRREFLLKLSQLPRTNHEQLESLEQLRVLEHGYAIKVGILPSAPPGIDTPSDYAAFVNRIRS